MSSGARKWYQQPLVWMIIAIPGSAVVVGIFMLQLAIRSDDGQVVDDYYKKGKAINRVLKRDREAARLGLEGAIVIAIDDNSLHLTLTQKNQAPLPNLLGLKLLHATRGSIDQEVSMVLTPKGIYRGFFSPMQPGRWYVQLETEEWRILGEWQYPQQTNVILRPTPMVEDAPNTK
ncbi:MAG: FixH family protein [Gammaproteobacteria bacterium]|nr:FixH family protein [Gammaproteobacteria bacterium]